MTNGGASKIFVTGASGKIGAKLVKQLLLNGHSVVALVRNNSKLPKDDRLKVIKADLLDLDKFKKEIRDSDYVYHLAAHQNPIDSNYEEFIRVNIEGTKSILNALIEAKTKKFIYVSTIMVFKPTGNIQRDEKWPKRTGANKNFYVETKLQALKVINDYKAKIPIVTLYPTIVIDANEIIHARRAPGEIMCMLGDGNRIINYIFSENLVNAMANALEKGKTGEDYILGGRNITAENYRREMIRIRHGVFIPIRISLNLVRLISKLPIPILKILAFIADNPPEDTCFTSQKAVRQLGLTIGELKDLHR